MASKSDDGLSLHPDDCLFDFPCSPEWRAYEDHLLGRRPLPATKTLRQARFDEDLERVRRTRSEMAEDELENDYDKHRDRHREMWDAINEIRRELQHINHRLEKLINQVSIRKPETPKTGLKVDL